MSDSVAKERCVARVYSGSSFGGHSCQRPSKVERNGKWYCGIHDPEYVAAKRATQEELWRAKWAIKDAAHKAVGERKAALETNAARYLYLRELPPIEAQALFWNFTSRKQRDAEIDRLIAAKAASVERPEA